MWIIYLTICVLLLIPKSDILVNINISYSVFGIIHTEYWKTTHAVFLWCSIEIIYVTRSPIYTIISNSVFYSRNYSLDYLIIRTEDARQSGASARKALQERLDPTSESSTRIAGSSDPSMSPRIPMTSGDSTPISGLDGVLSGGNRSRKRNDDMSDEERGKSRKKSRHIKKQFTYLSGEYNP